MSTWKVEYLDRVVDKYIDLEEHDRTVRCMVSYQYNFNVDRLTSTIKRLLDEMPILNSTFQEDNGKFFWNHRGENYDNIYDDWKDWTPFFSDYTSNFTNNIDAQIKILTYGNILAFRVNNMLMDIFGLKNLILYFCDLYNNLENVGYKSPYRNSADRSLKALVSRIPFMHKVGKSKLNNLKNDGFNLAEIPHQDNIEGSGAFLNSDGYFGDEATKLFEIASKYNTSVSNILLAAYHRTMAIILKQNGKPLNIGKQFDAREEVPGFRPYNNAHVFLPSVVTVNVNDTFVTTLNQVTKIQDLISSQHLVAKKISSPIKNIFGPTEYLQFVSMGRIEKSAIKLGANIATEIFFATPSRFLPYLSLSVCALDETEIYLSAISWCTPNDLPNVKYIFNWIKYEVRTLIHTEYPNFYKTYNEVEAKNATYNPVSKVSMPTTDEKGKKLTPAKAKAAAKKISNSRKIAEIDVGETASGKINKITTPKQITLPKNVWTLSQIDLAKKYEELTGSKLEADDSGKVKYKVKGKNVYQKRTWDEIKKFVDFKSGSKPASTGTGFEKTAPVVSTPVTSVKKSVPAKKTPKKVATKKPVSKKKK